MPDPQIDIDVIKEITDMFIEAGIHMDAVNVEGVTAVQNCTSRKLSPNAARNIFLDSEFYSLFFFSFILHVSARLCACLHTCVCFSYVQPTYKYCYDDTNSTRSAFDVLHRDV